METILKLENISKSFVSKGKKTQALKDVNLEVYRGETLGIVGESGCGKSTLARIIMGVYEPTQGKIYFEGEALNLKNRKNRLGFAKKAQMIFQDPYASLNPRLKVGSIIEENLVIHKNSSSADRKNRVNELLKAVGLFENHAERFPSEFSGGQRQRIAIARALIINPELLICDEPISALDVSIQSQIMNLLKKLKEDFALSYIFIAHDLNMVHYISNRVAVMYKGSVVELADTKSLYEKPRHPYTKLLWEASLTLEPKKIQNLEVCKLLEKEKVQENGEITEGCVFYQSCVMAKENCKSESPKLKNLKDNHMVACHYINN